MRRLLIVLFIVLPLGAFAQLKVQIESEVFWKPGVQLSDETQAVLTQLTAGSTGAGAGSRATVVQSGVGNVLGLSDIGGSTITATQVGSGNRTNLNNVGNSNRIGLAQTGDGNQIDFDLFGNQNTFGLTQNGSRNALELRNVQANNERLEIIQTGNSNRLTTDGYPFATGVPIRVEQTGGMQLQITNVR